MDTWQKIAIKTRESCEKKNSTPWPRAHCAAHYKFLPTYSIKLIIIVKLQRVHLFVSCFNLQFWSVLIRIWKVMHEIIGEWWKNSCRPLESLWYFLRVESPLWITSSVKYLKSIAWNMRKNETKIQIPTVCTECAK